MPVVNIILLSILIEAVVSAIKPLWSKDKERMSVAEIVSICLGIGSEVMCRPHAYQPVGSESTKTTGLYFFCLGLLAPYFERRCVRLATPAVSSVPRTM